MEYEEFRRVLTAFADKPANVDLDRNELLVEIRDETIQASLYKRPGDLFVEENGETCRASSWIVNRIARLPVLADRILTQISNEEYFIEPAGRLLDRMERSPEDAETILAEVSPTILSLLNERPAGTSTGVYLTSDAGEGKTTLIHSLAHYQAQKYKEKEADWLILPVSLGGRTLLRFDDVIIGTLVNTLRFPFLYYEAFVWLVRMGVIVPALDGFEEMFVEGQAGDAVTALGNLMQLLQSEGTILIAARSAYFEYKNLQVQVPLFDSIREQSADFARVHLVRWNRDRFIKYAAKRGAVDGVTLFEEVADKLGKRHPLLTRAVLVRRLIDVASDSGDRVDLIENITNEGYFENFIESIIAREAREKWIDRSGDPARPLLKVSQHRELLAEVALEMWVSETAVLKSDIFDGIADLYADACGMDVRTTNQIRERIRHHALIVPAADTGKSYRFDHDEFFHFFLGEAVAHTVDRGDVVNLRRVFRIARLPELSVDVAARVVFSNDRGGRKAIDTLNTACATEPRASFVKDNSGSLSMRLIDCACDAGQFVIKSMSFPVDSLRSRTIRNVEFRDCYFQRTDLTKTDISSCDFRNCQFGQIDFSGLVGIRQSKMEGCEVFSVVRSVDETAIFAPTVIERILQQKGFEVSVRRQEGNGNGVREITPDRHLVLAERICRAFLRSTGVNEHTIRQRLGREAGAFFDTILPTLMDHGVVVEVEYRGSGQQRRFQLGVPLDAVQRSIEQANGSFELFVGGIGK
ncbi:MAG: pentapeptide repeat-containing protein [Spirochaetaceae bacterium]|nr:pentapeptide repeat-containing protein [Spirochaetaceae bacterium]